MAVARKFMERHSSDDGVPLLRRWRGNWMSWRTTRWCETEEGTVRAQLYATLEQVHYRKDSDPGKVRRWEPNRHKIANVLEALRAITHLPDHVNPPTWMERDGTHDQQLNAEEIVSCGNGLLHVTTRTVVPHDPTFFNLVAVPFDYEPDASAPTWDAFLAELWPDDDPTIETLRQYTGYVLPGRTDLQKILFLIGPTRSGKGTIARIMQRLIGRENAAGPTLASLASNFGLAPLLGKPLAVISDARLSGNTHLVVERLLTISGEDTITVDRKFREPWTGKMSSRFVIISNELPSFGDSSGAIAHRLVVLVLTRSWLNKENPALTEQLAAELPGILNWALDGLDLLAKQGRFTEPQSSADAALAILDQASPMSAFVRDCCETGPGTEASVDTLYAAWKTWCANNGRDRPGTKQLFGRNLRSVVPGARVTQPREGGARVRMYQGVGLHATSDDTTDDPSRAGNEDDRVPTRATASGSGEPDTGTQWHAMQSKSAPTRKPSDRDGLVCPRCQRPIDRLITYPGGQRLGPCCAYPSERLTEQADTHDRPSQRDRSRDPGCDNCGAAPSTIIGMYRLCPAHAPAHHRVATS